MGRGVRSVACRPGPGRRARLVPAKCVICVASAPATVAVDIGRVPAIFARTFHDAWSGGGRVGNTKAVLAAGSSLSWAIGGRST